MLELLQVALLPANIIYSILLVVAILYWLLLLLGTLDFGSFDVDLDVDVDADVDVEVGGFAGALYFFNFGRLPFMVIFSVLALAMWSLSILMNYYFSDGTIWFPIVIFLPMLLVSLIIAKVLTLPLVPIFEQLNKGAEPVDYIGMTCKLLLPASSDKVGQAEVLHNGSPLLITVKVAEDQNPIPKGAEALILRASNDGKHYIIKRLND